MPNIKSLSVMAPKLWPMLKLSSNKQTDKQTNRQTNRQTDKQTGQKQYAPQILSGGHKNKITATATEPHRNRKLCQFYKDQYCKSTQRNLRKLRVSTAETEATVLRFALDTPILI